MFRESQGKVSFSLRSGNVRGSQENLGKFAMVRGKLALVYCKSAGTMPFLIITKVFNCFSLY